MAGHADNTSGRHGSRWRTAVWTAVAALVLLVPLLAMSFTDEVNWDLADFVFAGVIVLGVAVAYELAARMTGNRAYRTAVGFALAAAVLLVWINAAVGIIGTEGDPANMMYGAVLAVGVIGAIIARVRAEGMARTMFAAALAQALIAGIAVLAGMGYPESPPLEILGVNALFIALWLISAWLFRKAAREQAPARHSAVA